MNPSIVLKAYFDALKFHKGHKNSSEFLVYVSKNHLNVSSTMNIEKRIFNYSLFEVSFKSIDYWIHCKQWIFLQILVENITTAEAIEDILSPNFIKEFTSTKNVNPNVYPVFQRTLTSLLDKILSFKETEG